MDPAKSQKRAISTYDGGEATSPPESEAESEATIDAPAARGPEPAPSGAPVVGAALIVQAAHVIEAACRAGIDKHGLGEEERGIVGLLLERGKPTGLEAIASARQLDLETLRDVHEPRLERAGLVERTLHGRVATGKARAWYGRSSTKTPAAPDDEAKEGEGPGGDQSHGEAEGKGEDPSGERSLSGPNGGRRTIPILRLPFRFG